MPADPKTGVTAPSLRKLAGEGRAAVEWLRWAARRRAVIGVAEGRGQPVLLIPGFAAGDAATAPLRHRLNTLGFAAYGWGQGLNMGMSAHLKLTLAQRISELHDRHGCKVSLVGWSLGGVFVREMARHQTDEIARVFTLGSPFNVTPAANNMMPLFRLANFGKPVNLDWEGFAKRAAPPPVPCTAIYSKSDGIVAWPCACEDATDHTENVEVSGSHFGMPANPEVLQVIAERVARVEPDPG